MGQPLDETRQTRFPSTRTADTRSQQTNHREVEDAVLYLQENLFLRERGDALEVIVATLVEKITSLETRIADLEAKQD